jgi:hypothetical protein
MMCVRTTATQPKRCTTVTVLPSAAADPRIRIRTIQDGPLRYVGNQPERVGERFSDQLLSDVPSALARASWSALVFVVSSTVAFRMFERSHIQA